MKMIHFEWRLLQNIVKMILKHIIKK